VAPRPQAAGLSDKERTPPVARTGSSFTVDQRVRGRSLEELNRTAVDLGPGLQLSDPPASGNEFGLVGATDGTCSY
jgi:hypothetical protein